MYWKGIRTNQKNTSSNYIFIPAHNLNFEFKIISCNFVRFSLVQQTKSYFLKNEWNNWTNTVEWKKLRKLKRLSW